MFTFKAQKPITLNTPLLTDKNYKKVGLYTLNGEISQADNRDISQLVHRHRR
jgi:hypothetical protein